jgi:secondary thiamine-phosphate synthase enzyme
MLFKKSITTSKRNEFIDITGEIQKCVAESKVQNGICVVFVPHTTAAVTINENADPDVKRDIISYLEKLIPQGYNFHHSEGNSDSHIKSSIISPSITLIISNGSLLFGTWQGVYFCEFDGPRHRTYYVKCISD